MALAAALVVGGCTLLRPLDEYTDGPKDAAAADANTIEDGSSDDRGAPDGSSDSSPAVDGPNIDGGVEASFHCPRPDAANDEFCANFDQGQVITGFLGTTPTQLTGGASLDSLNGGTIAIGDGGLSPPGLLDLTTPAVTGANSHARLDLPASTDPTNRAVLRFHMRIAPPIAQLESTLATLTIANPDGGAPVNAYYYASTAGDDLISIEVDGQGTAMETVARRGRDEWVRVELVLSLGPPLTLSVAFDDVFHRQTESSTNAFSTGDEASFRLGLDSENPSDPIHMQLDNVRFGR